jgi:ABC-type nitrate/sulfonate/bicarbonate transport system permease component
MSATVGSHPVLRGGGFIVGVLALWEIANRLRWVNPVYLSSPSKIAVAFSRLVSTPSFWSVDFSSTAKGFIAGWLLAIAVGVPLGVIMGLYGPIRDMFEPLFNAF